MDEDRKARAEDELWRLAFKKLVFWSMKKHRLNPADAEEVVQEAIRQFLAAGGTPDPADPKGLLLGVGSRVNGIAVDRRRKKASKAVTLTADGSAAEPDDPPLDPEQSIINDDVARKAVSALLDRAQGDDLVIGVVMQTAEGVEAAADQAKALQVDVGEVYNARRRLKDHVDAIKKLVEGW